MKLNLTNNQTYPVPILSSQGEGFAEELPPSEAYLYDGPATVLVIGNKPDVMEQIETGLAVIAGVAKRIIAAWQGRNHASPTSTSAAVNVTIINNGENAVRVILGDGTTDVTVSKDEAYSATAWGYIELRELGVLDPSQVDGGKQPAEA